MHRLRSFAALPTTIYTLPGILASALPPPHLGCLRGKFNTSLLAIIHAVMNRSLFEAGRGDRCTLKTNLNWANALLS